MSAIQEKSRRLKSPYERLQDLLRTSKLSREIDGTHGEIYLVDAVISLWDMRKPLEVRGQDLSEDRFYVGVSRQGSELDEPTMGFIVSGRGGLIQVFYPTECKLRVGDKVIAQYDLGNAQQVVSIHQNLHDPRFRDARTEAGHTMVDWLEEMRELGIYFDPPISFTPHLPEEETNQESTLAS